MYVNKVCIENYRATEKAEYLIDPEKNIIVGKNNAGKTSCFEFMRLALCDEGSLTFDDYPIFKRKKLYECFLDYANRKISFEKLESSISYPAITFTIDYSDDEEDANLEVLHSAIIDVDESINYAQICLALVLSSEDNIKKALKQIETKINDINLQFKEHKISKEEVDRSLITTIRDLIKDKFKSLFLLKQFSVNPTNGKRRLLDVHISEIINAKFIDAQRPIEMAGENIFNSVLKRFLKTKTSSLTSTANLEEQIDLKKYDFQLEFNEHLNKILEEFYLNEYPAGSKETGVDINLDIDLEQMIIDGASIYYRDSKENEKLPQRYNGLGYKNLLLMELEIAAFAFETKNKTPNSPCLLFIEEPESHMHPQLQERFVEFINEFVEKITGDTQKRKCPIILSTHSSHIANIVDFSKIRYVIRENNKTICKNLNDFAYKCKNEEEEKENIEFLKKYLTLTKCDLFFADKIIIVEGGSERIYIPYCISKLKEQLKDSFNLDRQYYTILEIGGAYGYLFIPFLRFLQTPTLIITDLDSVDEAGKRCLVSKAHNTSNRTIVHWFEDELKQHTFSFDDIKNLAKEKKIAKHISIAYQTKENDLIGRTLEPAIKISNKDVFGIQKEEDLDVSELKINFALDLVSEKINAKVIPDYIKQGLVWLNNE